MRTLSRFVLATAILAGPGAGLASAVTARDLVELAKAGLSDDILIALFQSDGTIFFLAAPDVIALRSAGLSEKVILAMLKTRQTKPAAPVAPAPPVPAVQPDVVEPAASDLAEPERSAPTVVHVHQTVVQENAPAPVQTVYVPVAVFVPVRATPPIAAPPAPPAYWGWAGKASPHSWGAPDKKDPPSQGPKVPASSGPKGSGG